MKNSVKAAVLAGVLIVSGLAISKVLAACNLPHFQDKYIGFKVGKPAGWSINYVNGAITLRKDEAGKTTAIVYPVKPRDDQSAEDALNDYANLLKDVFQKAGDSLNVQSSGAADNRASLKLAGDYKNSKIQGELQAARKGSQLLITGGWSEAWAKNRSTIFTIGECYQKTAGQYLSRARRTGGGDYMGGATTTFDYALPPGWKVSGITFRGIDLNYDDVTGVSYAYLTNAVGSTTPDQFISQIAQMAGFSNMRFLGEQALGTTSDPFGMTWEMKAKEYEATFKGARVHGVMTAAVSNVGMYGYGSYSAMLSMRQARASQWDQFSAITAVIQESIRIADAKAGQGLILPKNNPADTDTVMGSWEYKNRSEDRLSAKWQESIMGYDNVQSPTTGQTYQAPLNSWNDTGSDGPGYYRALPNGEQEKLDLVNP